MAGARLRISGGSARGTPLTEPRGVRLRPTSGLVREAVFNILGDIVDGARVADLYAGTGALGIEALSRGAAHAVFIEAEAASCQAIVQSLARTGFDGRTTVLRGRLPAALKSIPGPLDLVLMDPPYHDETAPETLNLLAEHMARAGLVVYEHGSKYNPPERPIGLVLSERRIYGDTAVALYVLQEGE
jgi:16S rRNA (guanine966-N2)-methyltransferase